MSSDDLPISGNRIECMLFFLLKIVAIAVFLLALEVNCKIVIEMSIVNQFSKVISYKISGISYSNSFLLIYFLNR
jgi:hypothetical protein